MGYPIFHSQYTAAQIEASIGKTPRIKTSTRTWEVWDISTSAYVDTGVSIDTQLFVDDTLTEAGYAADAKVTGDRFALDEDLISLSLDAIADEAKQTYTEDDAYTNPVTLNYGGVGLSTGGNYQNAAYCRTNFLPISGPVLIVVESLSGYMFDGWFYSRNASSAGTHSFTNQKYYPVNTPLILEPGTNDAYFRIGFKREDGSTLTTDITDPTSDYSLIRAAVKIYTKPAVDEITEIKDRLEQISETVNLFYFDNTTTRTVNGLSMEFPDKYTVKMNGQPTSEIRLNTMGRTSGLTLTPGKTYKPTRTLVSGSYTGSPAYYRLYTEVAGETVMTTLTNGEPFTIPLDGLNPSIVIVASTTGSFTDCIFSYEFVEVENAYTAVDQVARAAIEAGGIDPKKPYQSGPIPFAVTVDRPVAFGGNDTIIEPEDVLCAMQLPSSYTPTGAKTRLVLVAHGQYSQITETGWNSSASELVSRVIGFLNTNGYACFDVNTLNTGTDADGYTLGSPLAVQVAYAAYEYIRKNYNVFDEIFVLGVSMGGVLASAFANAYPGIVLAEASFAGRDFIKYLYQAKNNEYKPGGTSEPYYPAVYGYADMAALVADGWSHAEGVSPSLSLVKHMSGAAVFAPNQETDYEGWVDYFAAFYTNRGVSPDGEWSGIKPVPYKSWNSWADNAQDTQLELNLKEAYRRGHSKPYFTVEYETGTHNQLCYGKISGQREELLAWFKRWAP